MQVRLRIKRQEGPTGRPYIEEFLCEAALETPVSALLEELNSRPQILTADGVATTPIDWECGCRQQACGACSMVINGRPRLACSTFVGDLSSGAPEAVIELAPLSKFPLVRDLRVDRQSLRQDAERLRLWLEAPAVADSKELSYQYQSASCLLCGCCLEVCPNYWPGRAFGGAALMHQTYRTASQTPPGAARKELMQAAQRAGGGHCSKTLSCAAVCPLELPLASLISRTNHLYLQSLFQRKRK